jgi:hypothetical protein
LPPAPTVPLPKPSLGGEAFRAGRFRVAAPEPGVLAPLPPGSFSDRSRSRFPRGLPDQGRSPGGSPFGGLELTSLFPPSRFLGRSFGSVDGGILGRSLGFRLTAMDRSPGSAGFAAPGPKPGPARQIRSRSSFSAGGDALTEIPLSAGLVLNPKVRCPAWWLPSCPKAGSETVGALRSLPLSHPLKGKPAASAWRRLRQPPCLSLPPALPPEGDRLGFGSGCGWEGFPPLPGDRLGHPGKLS